ncbi:MAG: nucleotidyltransferase domain-containing protein [Nitrospirae bacterium]|nr:nucleotidyltransferase domain-containing protein [Nitrospirota bacterium]
MIPQHELEQAIEIAKKHGVGKLYLIGSSLYKDSADANDYDFAVSDVPVGNFFKFYGELFRKLSKNVDLIDLSGGKTKFKDIIIKEGKLIYDKAAA